MEHFAKSIHAALEEGRDQEQVRDNGWYLMWHIQAVSMRTASWVQNIGQLCPASLLSKSRPPDAPPTKGRAMNDAGLSLLGSRLCNVLVFAFLPPPNQHQVGDSVFVGQEMNSSSPCGQGEEVGSERQRKLLGGMASWTDST